MATILKAIVFTAGQSFAFNVVLPIWYLLIKIFNIG